MNKRNGATTRRQIKPWRHNIQRTSPMSREPVDRTFLVST